MKIFIAISRLIVGSLFIVSGLIKANDSLGFMYKLNDYFASGVLNLEFLIPYSLWFAVLICVVEIVLGVALIFGFKSKITTTLILLMMLFFTWLTWYTSNCIEAREIAQNLGEEFSRNCVEDCGCFGDALKLKPIESFYKDIFLLVFAIPLFFASFKKMIPENKQKEDLYYMIASLLLIIGFGVFVIGWWFTVLFSLVLFIVVYFVKNKTKSQWISLILAFAIPLGFTLYSLRYLPVKDFRPYAIGNNISEGMIDDNYEDDIDAPIHDFFLSDANDNDLTDAILEEDKVMLVVIYDIDISDFEGLKNVKEITDKAIAKNYKVYGVSSSYIDDLIVLKQQLSLNFDFLSCDGTTLKTIIRANPGIVTLEKGTVIGKWNAIDLDDVVLK